MSLADIIEYVVPFEYWKLNGPVSRVSHSTWRKRLYIFAFGLAPPPPSFVDIAVPVAKFIYYPFLARVTQVNREAHQRRDAIILSGYPITTSSEDNSPLSTYLDYFTDGSENGWWA